MIRYPQYKTSVTPAGGSVAWNTRHLTGDLVTIHIQPTTDSTTFKFKMLDADGLQIYCTVTDRTGEITLSYDGETLDDIVTCTIYDASVDEVFLVKFRLRSDIQNR